MIDFEKESKQALQAAHLELTQMHAHYCKNCEGGCPTLDAIAKTERVLNFRIVHVIAARWWDKSAGNTYHKVRVAFEDGENVVSCEDYGYGDSYKQTAHELIASKFADLKLSRSYSWIEYEEKGIVAHYTVTDGTRREMRNV